MLFSYSSIRKNHITEEIEGSISAKQDEVKDAIAASDAQRWVLENKIENFFLNSDHETASTLAEEMAGVL
jgi:metal-responsive CopG/Arc/MetJ family transcriptional regulator